MVQYVFRTVPARDSLGIAGEIDFVVNIILDPKMTPEQYASYLQSPKMTIGQRTREIDGHQAMQTDFDSWRDPRPTEGSAGTRLLVEDGRRLIEFVAFGPRWEDYQAHAAQVEAVFQSITFRASSALTTLPIQARGVVISGRVIAGLPLWIGKESQGPPGTQTGASGEFTITTTGIVGITVPHPFSSALLEPSARFGPSPALVCPL